MQVINARDSHINMAAFLPKSFVNGPGSRAVIWVQGCPHRCLGCFNSDMLETKQRELIAVDELAIRILGIPDIEGVTFSGGEPFEQAGALAKLAECLRDNGLNVMVFTGYTYAELTAGTSSAWHHLIQASDLLVTGPFMADKPTRKYLCGSDNQELIFVSEILKDHPDIARPCGNNGEIIINEQGEVIFTGINV